MPGQSGSEIKAGVMLVISVGLLAVLLAAVGPCRSLLYEKAEINVVFKDVSGLKPNSPVRYSGVEIGRVKQITIIQLDEANLARLPKLERVHVFELPIGDPEEADRLYDIADPEERARQVLEAIRGKTMVQITLEVLRVGEFESCHVDDRVTIDSTLMGDTSVEVAPGSGGLCPAGKVLIGDTGTLYTDLRDGVNDIRRMMRRAGRALGGEKVEFKKAISSFVQGAERFGEIADNIEVASKGMREIVSSNKEDVRATVKDLKAAAAAGRGAVEDGAPRVRTILQRGEKVSEVVASKATEMADKLAALVESARRSAAAAEGLMLSVKPQLGEVMEEAKVALRRASNVGEEAQALFGESRPEVRRALLNIKGTTRNVEEMTALLARKPWLVLRPSRDSDRDVATLYVSTRHLYEATARLSEATEQLGELARTGRLTKADTDRLRALLEDVRETTGGIEKSRRAVEARVEEIRRPKRKGGGRRFERSREPAPEFPGLDELKKGDGR